MTGLVDLVNVVNTGSAMDSASGSKKFETVLVKPKEIKFDLLPIEMVTKEGIVLKFLNSNSMGATSMVGVTQIGLNDPRRMPAYVMRNLGIIWQHAERALQTHFKLTLSSTGSLEALNPDDFSICFSWASLSEYGVSLTQYNRPDLVLGYGMCDRVLQLILMSRSDPEPVYVINVYIQLQEPSRKRTVVLKRAKEEALARVQPPAAKNLNKGPGPSNGGNFSQWIAIEAANVVMKKAMSVTFNQSFTVLPIGQGPTSGPNWSNGDLVEMPDNY
jgi:hypothetical protein